MREDGRVHRAGLTLCALVAALCGWDVGSALAGSPPGPTLNPRTLRKFVDPLPIPAVMDAKAGGAIPFELTMSEFLQKLHAQLPPTKVWGYNGSFPGPTIEAARGVSINVKWTNSLPAVHLFQSALDTTVHGADLAAPFVRAVVHLHGGATSPQSNGYPEAWFTPGFSATYVYTNVQQPAALWYHDAAQGISRLNVLAGLAGLYLVRDPLNEPAGLPAGPPYEVPLIIQDRSFNKDGSLFYPSVGDNPAIHPQWVPEFFGNTILVNGMVWPNLNVRSVQYRFRLLNGSNSRVYTLTFRLAECRSLKLRFRQIGTDGGYLREPVWVSSVTLAPGERADILVDFSGLPSGTKFILANSAPAPFPNGASPDSDTVGQVMQLRVSGYTWNPRHDLPDPLNIIPTLKATSTRTLTLNEVAGPKGPQTLLLGGSRWTDPITEKPALGSTEIWEIANLTASTHAIHLHLVQFQVLNRQPFNKKRYLKDYNKANPVVPSPDPSVTPIVPLPLKPYLNGDADSPPKNERGWKDTVRANPGQVTRLIVRFTPNDGTPAFPFDPTSGNYLWQCGMLEHADNEMMRPYRLSP